MPPELHVVPLSTASPAPLRAPTAGLLWFPVLPIFLAATATATATAIVTQDACQRPKYASKRAMMVHFLFSASGKTRDLSE